MTHNTGGVPSPIADVFPVKHLSSALQESYDPFAVGTPWPWQHWPVIALWGVAAAVVAVNGFRWTPRR